MSTQAQVTTDNDQLLCLTVSSRTGDQKVFPLDKNNIIIGRETDCHIVLADSSISKRHATVAIHEGVTSILDGADNEPSSNGVYVNGKKIERPVVLREGDEVSLGLFHFEVVSAATIRESISLSDIRTENDLIRFLERGALTETRLDDLLDILNSLGLSTERCNKLLDTALDLAMKKRQLKRVAVIARVKIASEHHRRAGTGTGGITGKTGGEHSTLLMVAAFGAAAVALGAVIIWALLF